MSQRATETEILRLLASAESRQQGFVALMECYREPLYWHIRRLVVTAEDAQDVLQECFIKVHRHIESFRGDSSLKTWLYRVATNEAMRLHRRHRIETSSYDEKGRLIEIFESEPEVDYSSLEAQLQRAILALPATQRVVFNLRYYDEMSYEQIAQVTESSVASLKSSYHYAMKRIKEYMLNRIDN